MYSLYIMFSIPWKKLLRWVKNLGWAHMTLIIVGSIIKNLDECNEITGCKGEYNRNFRLELVMMRLLPCPKMK